jgi:membrane protein YqaA with SNARE-associated domain
MMLGSEILAAYGYLGLFLICLIGNSSVLIPFPFALFVYSVGSVCNPFIVGIICGIGSVVGKMVSYLLGRGSHMFLNGRSVGKVTMLEFLEKYGAIGLFLYSMTPLPDDLVLFPLGVINFSIKKTFIPMLIGKTIFCVVVAFAGAYSSIVFIDLLKGDTFVVVALAACLFLIIILGFFRDGLMKLFQVGDV